MGPERKKIYRVYMALVSGGPTEITAADKGKNGTNITVLLLPQHSLQTHLKLFHSSFPSSPDRKGRCHTHVDTMTTSSFYFKAVSL